MPTPSIRNLACPPMTSFRLACNEAFEKLKSPTMMAEGPAKMEGTHESWGHRSWRYIGRRLAWARRIGRYAWAEWEWCPWLRRHAGIPWHWRRPWIRGRRIRVPRVGPEIPRQTLSSMRGHLLAGHNLLRLMMPGCT